MANKNEITTIVRSGNECIVYHDDGMFCSWTDKKTFNFETISEVKNNTTGYVMLVTEEEAQAFAGEHMKMENHNAWVISKDILWILEGRFEPRASEEDFINFIKEHLI